MGFTHDTGYINNISLGKNRPGLVYHASFIIIMHHSSSSSSTFYNLLVVKGANSEKYESQLGLFSPIYGK
jgi:hypothetical protein